MHNRIGLLAGLAALQLLLIAVFWFGDGGDADESAILLDFDVAQVDQFTIASADSEVNVVLVDDGWQVADAPADADKVQGLLDKLAALEAPWPVGTSADIAERFEVSDSNYQRLISLKAADEILAQGYFGTSPGYQRVHARAAGADSVYAVKLSNYELGLNIDAWLDKAIMAVDGAVSRVALTEPMAVPRVLARELTETGEAAWRFNDADAENTKAETYVNRFANLRVLGLAEEPLVASADLLATIELSGDAGAVRYEILGTPAAVDDEAADPDEAPQEAADQISTEEETSAIDQYLIKREDIDRVYRLATYVAEQLLMQDTDFQAI